MGAQAKRYGPAYIRRLNDEYRRDLKMGVFPFPPFSARALSFSFLRCSYRASLLALSPPPLSARAAAVSLARRYHEWHRHTSRRRGLVAAPSLAHRQPKKVFFIF
jgi:hypothetical protein